MNPKKLLSTLAGMGLAGGLLFAGQAQAGFLNSGNPPDFDGFSVFGAGAPPCPLCDSTVNYALYQTEDSNWQDDAAFGGNAMESGVLLPDSFPPPFPVAPGTSAPFAPGVADHDTDFVFLYQVVNTDPLPDPGMDQVLENFNIAIEGKKGEPVLVLDPTKPEGKQPYTSAGFLMDKEFDNLSSATDPLDNPWDWEAEQQPDVTPIIQDNGNEPDGVRLDLIANAQVAGGAPFVGIQFIWDSPGLIDLGDRSSLLFLTFDCPAGFTREDGNQEGCLEWIDFVWAETQSPGGFGQAGDVPGVKVAPEPATLALLSLGLAGVGVVRRRRNTA